MRRKTSRFAAATGTTLFTAGLLLAPHEAARADLGSDLLNCATTAISAAGKCLYEVADVGGKVLSFVAEPANAVCISKLGGSVPDTLIMGTTIGLANANVLPRDKNGCSSAIIGKAAAPMGAALQGVPVLKFAGDQLVGVAAGQVSAAGIPFLDSFDCGCKMVDAGLSVDTVKRVIGIAHEVDKVGSACGGALWDAAKNIIKGLYTFDADAIVAGISGLGSWLNNTLESPFQSPHIPVDVYWARYWVPRIDEVALGIHQGRDVWTPVVRPTWETCKNYFDSHRMSSANAQGVCDDMRDGNSPPRRDGRFVNAGFEDRVQRRLFEMNLLGVVQEAATNAIAKFNGQVWDFAPGVPAAYFSQADVVAAVDEVYGTYNGQVLGTPALMVPFPLGTVAEKTSSVYPKYSQLLDKAPGLVVPRASIKQVFDIANASYNPNDQQVRDVLTLKAGVAKARFAAQQAADKLLAQNEWFARDVVQLSITLNVKRCNVLDTPARRAACGKQVGELVKACQTQQFEAYYAQQQNAPPRIRVPGAKAAPPRENVVTMNRGFDTGNVVMAFPKDSMPPNLVNVFESICSDGAKRVVAEYQSRQPKVAGVPVFSTAELRQTIAAAPLRKLKFDDRVFTDPDAAKAFGNEAQLQQLQNLQPMPPAQGNRCAALRDLRQRQACERGGTSPRR